MVAAYQVQDPNCGSLPVRLAAKASRFIARQSRSKLLTVGAGLPMVTFTFDDVPASACERGARILEEHGARGTFYVAASGCGTPSPEGSRRASIDQLRTIWANGHELGCHTYSHCAVRRISFDQLGLELDRNRSALRQVDGRIAVRNFAYPYGDLSIGTKRYLEGRFDSCRSTHAGINSGLADLGALHAWPLQDAALDHAKIADLIAETTRRCGWLIFFSHEVAESPSGYGVSPDLLDWAVGTAKKSGCAVTTVADGLNCIRGRGNGE